jgi:deoxyribonuclease-4
MKFGLHISTAGDLAGTPARARAMGADVIQIFAGSPRTWRQTVYSPDRAKAFRDACGAARVSSVFIHMLYLVAYGTANEELRQKSIIAMRDMLGVADQLGAVGVITHMGSHSGLEFAEAARRVADALTRTFDQSQHSYLILENSAGAGSVIGDTLEELATIYEYMGQPKRVKFCLDTCHLLASGYEVRQPDSWHRLLDDFDRLIGLEHLVALHLNDSKGEINTKLDRHENIGDGTIGYAGFKHIVNDPRLKDLPGMLEVPGIGDQGPDKENLDRLKALVA